MVVPIVFGIALEELALYIIATGAAIIYADQTMNKDSGTRTSSKPTWPNSSETDSSKSSETTQSDLFNYSADASIDEIIERELHSQSIGLEQEYSRISYDEKARLRAETLALITTLVTSQNCDCPPDTYKRVKLKPIRRGMSLLSLDYQSAICDVEWYIEEGNKKSNLIPEWVYFQGPGDPPVDFDGWLPRFCLFLEVKARYDFLFQKGLGKPVLNNWALGYYNSLVSQAKRQNKVCDFNPPAKCCWVWMTPKAYLYFENIKRNFPHLLSIFVPLSFY
ncbi:Tox-REase-5 domain-containing protein [Gilliamella sp. CG16]|uniref:Tox-REase-5 domain-containing protein n=1 Tax=Gilliamella sp. CG16 TaxID=3351503 RepID=UPI003987DA78